MPRFERPRTNDRKTAGPPRRDSRMDRGRSARPPHDQKRYGNQRRDAVMTQVVCASCHENCEVPFKPTGDKPIYCSNCFSKQDKPGPSRSSDKQLDVINAKLDKIMQALEIR